MEAIKPIGFEGLVQIYFDQKIQEKPSEKIGEFYRSLILKGNI